MRIKIDSAGYFLHDAPGADADTPETAPHMAADGTTPDGMRRARYVLNSWTDEGASELAADLVLENENAITAEATRIIEAAYSPLKQRKLMSMALALQDKQLQGQTLTAAEDANLQLIRDVNAWITGIRAAENAAIAAGTPWAEVVWPV